MRAQWPLLNPQVILICTPRGALRFRHDRPRLLRSSRRPVPDDPRSRGSSGRLPGVRRTPVTAGLIIAILHPHRRLRHDPPRIRVRCSPGANILARLSRRTRTTLYALRRGRLPIPAVGGRSDRRRVRRSLRSLHGPVVRQQVRDRHRAHGRAVRGARQRPVCGRQRDPAPLRHRPLLNLTLASPSVNRNQKRDHDAAEWLPDRNRCWFADRVVAVRQEYGLTIDRREAAALDRVLSTCSSTELVMLAGALRQPPRRPLAARATASPNGTTMGTAVSAARRLGRTGSHPCRVATPPIRSCVTAMETGWSVNEATVPVVSKNTNELKIGAPERFGL